MEGKGNFDAAIEAALSESTHGRSPSHFGTAEDALASSWKADRLDTLAILNPELSSLRHKESENPWLRLRHGTLINLSIP